MAERIETSGPIEIDHGYFEYRVNWGGQALLDMSAEEMARFKQAMATLDLLTEVPDDPSGHVHDFRMPGGGCSFPGCKARPSA